MKDTKQKFRNLLKPGHIGTMDLRNRIVMSPMGTYLAARDGTVTDRMKRYYEERAKGGAALIIVEVAAVDHPRGRGMTRQIGISEDKFIPGLSELAETIHKHGAKVAIQLHHGGRIAAPFLSGGHEAVAPSTIPLIPEELGKARELTVPEIRELVQRFAAAAQRAKQAGIDGVEIHAGHGYLIEEFLSRSSNFRQDNYGGSLENRARFLLEIVSAVREAVGREYPVWCRVDGMEYGIENGITPDESREIALKLESAGIDALHVSGYGGSYGVGFTLAPLVHQPCYLIPQVRNIKQAVKVPIIGVGRIGLEQAEKILRQLCADFIAMGRPLLADPELPIKIAQDRRDEIRKCIYCYTCVHQIFVRNNICCAVNPAVGKESEPLPAPSLQKKKVLIAGGGPAGMAAAISAATRGHDVTLVEKDTQLGGSLLFAAIVRPENFDILQYLANQVKKLGINVELGTRFDPALIEKIQPDAIVIATGTLRRNPSLPGIENPRVIDGDILRKILSGNLTPDILRKLSWGQRVILITGLKIFQAALKPPVIRRFSRLWMPLGNKITIIGAGMIGCELAVFLAERGRKVTVVEAGNQIAPEMALPMKWRTEFEMERLGVTLLTEVSLDKIRSSGLNIVSKDGSKKTLQSDNIIIATGAEPDSSLAEKLQDKAKEVYFAGDCSKLGFIKEAVADGTRIGSMI